MGVVAVAASGLAHAEGSRTLSRTIRSTSEDTPWYQRFTANLGEPARISSLPQSSGGERSVSLPISGRWGLTLNVRDADRSRTATRDETAIGAFYDFTPRLRVGGELRVADPPVGGAPGAADQSSADVKLESAFRF
jgi:hypothetical protein